MTSVTKEDQSVEFVEFLDVPVYENQDQEIVTIDDSTETNELHEVITISNDSDNNAEQADKIEYIEAEELDDQHTIIVHDGRQYVIPTEQLHQAGNTIVLEDGDDEEIEQVIEEDEQSVFYTEVDAETAVATGLGRQYAVLRDGKLHIQETNESESANGEDDDEMQQKLRVLEHTLNSYEEVTENQPTDHNQSDENQEEEVDEDDDTLSQITGKNLITGQTITLSGFLEKIRRRGIDEVEPTRRGSQSRFGVPPNNDYVLLPPVNRRVVVGRTPEGRKLVGRILQIQKKVPANLPAQVPPRRQYQRRQQTSQRRNQQQPAPQVPRLPASITCSPLLDENVSRTLTGLMELESVERSLADQRIIVRHVQRRSRGGRAVPGSRRVAYYRGKMARVPPANWHFAPDPPPKPRPNLGIDVTEDGNQHQVKVSVNEHGVVFTAVEDDGSKLAENPTPGECSYDTDDNQEDETITVYLTVTQDEFGKKRTKVTIPQLANTTRPGRPPRNPDYPSTRKYVCSVCGKRLTSSGALRRHAAFHDPTLPYIASSEAVKRFRCDTCGQQFHRHSNLLRHVEIHQQRSPVPSDLDSIVSSGDFNDSRKVPYTCETCGCQYNFVSSLTRHIVNNHMASVAKDDLEATDDSPMVEENGA